MLLSPIESKVKLYLCGVRERRLAAYPVVMRSSPVTGQIRCALLVNQPIFVESTFVAVSLFMY